MAVISVRLLKLNGKIWQNANFGGGLKRRYGALVLCPIAEIQEMRISQRSAHTQ